MEIQNGTFVAFRVFGSSLGIVKSIIGDWMVVDDGKGLNTISRENIVPLIQLYGKEQYLHPELALQTHLPEIIANLAMMLAQKTAHE